MKNELKKLFCDIALYSSFISFYLLYIKEFYKKFRLKPEYLLLLIPFIWAFFANFLYIKGWARDSLWDINVVYCADLAYSNNLDPYNDWFENPGCMESIPLKYPYLKLLLDFLPFSMFEYDFFEKIWVFLLGIMLITYAFITKKMFQLEISIIFIVFFISFLFQGANMVALQSGNISTLVYLIVFIGIYFLKSPKYQILFFVCLALATFVKFHLGILLLMPFVLNNKFNYRGYIVYFSILFSLFYINYLLHGEFLSKWLTNLAYVDWGLKPYYSDISFLKTLWVNKIRDVEFNAIVKLLLAPLFIINLILFKKFLNNKVSHDEKDNILIALCSLAFILILPRLKVYDFLFVSCVSLKIYIDSVKTITNKLVKIRIASSIIILIFYLSFIYWRPQWDGDNRSYFHVLSILFLYQGLLYFKLKSK